jgi:Zn finger protein HypA/HybF involved in hydrogenase expression
MVKVTPEKFRFRILNNAKGKVVVLNNFETLDTQMQTQCAICYNVFIRSARELSKKKGTACPECESKTPNYLTKHDLNLASFMQSNLQFNVNQLSEFFGTKFKDIKLPKCKEKRDHLIVLSLDPGTSNFGVAVTKLYGNTAVIKSVPLESRMLVNTFSSINSHDLKYKKRLFLKEISSLIKKYKPDIVVMERFQSRGFSVNSNEIVNIMISLIIGLRSLRKINVKIVPPSGWKKRVNMVFNLKEEYKKISGTLTPHQLDAMLIANSVFPDKNNPFRWLEDQEVRVRFYADIVAKSWQLQSKKQIKPV